MKLIYRPHGCLVAFLLFAGSAEACFKSDCLRNTTNTVYYLEDNFSGDSFFDNFYFETMDDYTHGKSLVQFATTCSLSVITFITVGYVNYVDRTTAFDEGLAQFWGEQVYIGVDHTHVVGNEERGRKSIRITSNKAYNGSNLIVIDAEHMPTSMGALPNGCAVWPAFWTVGPNWPNTGEIDIIEYVNTQPNDLTTLHTSDGCSQASEDIALFTGTWATATDGVTPATDCSVYAANQYSNQGCGINGWSQPVGHNFNLQRGGVYALEWVRDEYIRAFYFPRDAIPRDLVDNAPQPDSWGTPYARFISGGDACTGNHFRDQQIVLCTTFCGDWAGSTFPAQCGSEVSCEDYVKCNPSDFQQTFWLLNYVKVFARLE
jgi:hypothetical protein